MIRLQTLGGLDLVSSDGRKYRSVLRQPKRFGLLTLLAMDSRRGHCRRDSILATLWPDYDERRARNALSQALHYLRERIGRDVITRVGRDGLAVDRERLWCDAVAFEDATDENDLEGALELYGGDFLAGFFVDHTPPFEHWADAQRARLRTSASRAAHTLIARREAHGRLRDAAGWAERALSISPGEERAARRLIDLLDRCGDAASALAAYDRFRRHLAQAYDTAPSSETRQLVAAIRARASEADPEAEPAPVDSFDDEVLTRPPADDGEADPGASSAPSAPDPPDAGATRRRPASAPGEPWLPPRYRWLRVVVPIALVAAAVLWGSRVRIDDDATSHAAVGSFRIVVSPFNNFSTDARLDRFADGLTAALVDALGRVERIEVVLADAATGDDAAPAAGFRVTGGIWTTERRVRVSAQLLEAVSGVVLRPIVIDRERGDLLSLIDALSEEIAATLRLHAGREIQLREWRSGANDQRAARLFELAVAAQRSGHDLRRSRSIEAALDAFLRADSLLARSESADPEWAQPALMRARVLSAAGGLFALPAMRDPDRHRRYLTAALEHADRALARTPLQPDALEMRGMLRYRLALARPAAPADSVAALLDTAVDDLEHAVLMEGGRPLAWSTLSAVHFSSGRLPEAYAAAKQAYAADAYLVSIDEILGRLFTSAFELGRDADARRWCTEIGERSPENPLHVHCNLMLLGWADSSSAGSRRQAAWGLLREVTERSRTARPMRPHFDVLVAGVLARSGLRDSALAVLRRATAGADDPELLQLEAGVRVRLGQLDEAIDLLDRYTGQASLGARWVFESRRFQALHGRPGFQRLSARR